jgi:hypothetical protein
MSLKAYAEHNARRARIDAPLPPVERQALPDASDPMATTIRAAIDDKHRTEFEIAFGSHIEVHELAMPERAT